MHDKVGRFDQAIADNPENHLTQSLEVKGTWRRRHEGAINSLAAQVPSPTQAVWIHNGERVSIKAVNAWRVSTVVES